MNSLFRAAFAALTLCAVVACSGAGTSVGLPSTNGRHPAYICGEACKPPPTPRATDSYTAHSMPMEQCPQTGTCGPAPSPTPQFGSTPFGYHNGPIILGLQVYVSYVGWQSDPAGEGPYLEAFLRGIGGNPWLNIPTQYNSSSSGIGSIRSAWFYNQPNILVGTYQDPTPLSLTPTDADILAAARRAYAYFANPYGVYIIATASLHSANIGANGYKFCSEHLSDTGSTGSLLYINLPYVPDQGSNCYANIVNSGAAGKLDGVSLVTGHELAEIVSDPIFRTGWSSDSQEIGDICAESGPFANLVLPTGTFAVQALWDAKTNSCDLASPNLGLGNI